MAQHDLWFVLYVVIIGGYVILDGFDLGVGMLGPIVAKDDRDKRVLLNSIGPVWDGNEVWLVLGGGALFAAFPLVYASLFSGFYLAMMLVLLVLILRTVAIEFRSKRDSAALAHHLGLVLLRLVARHHRAARRRPRQRHPGRADRRRTATWTSTWSHLLNPYAHRPRSHRRGDALRCTAASSSPSRPRASCSTG